ncbi:MAG: MOFRL family protein, partial [Pirellulaceae bacterium]
TATPAEALEVLQRFGARESGIAPAVFDVLQRAEWHREPSAAGCPVTNLVIGNNATAVDAAGQEAERRGYSHVMLAARELEGPAEDIGRHHARIAARMRDEPGPDCLITGGEPTVHLAPSDQRGRGGRNQQLALAAFAELVGPAAPSRTSQRDSTSQSLDGIALLSGGTDGEDGPTDAAGAWIDADLARRWSATALAPGEYLRRNDAYTFFEQPGGLLKTGPTHTNVCDVRVVVTSQSPRGS